MRSDLRTAGPHLNGPVLGLVLCMSLLVAAACRPAADPPPATLQTAAPTPFRLPADIGGVLTYQRDGNMYVLPLETKTERKLTDFPATSPAIFSARSPDGARL